MASRPWRSAKNSGGGSAPGRRPQPSRARLLERPRPRAPPQGDERVCPILTAPRLKALCRAAPGWPHERTGSGAGEAQKRTTGPARSGLPPVSPVSGPLRFWACETRNRQRPHPPATTNASGASLVRRTGTGIVKLGRNVKNKHRTNGETDSHTASSGVLMDKGRAVPPALPLLGRELGQRRLAPTKPVSGGPGMDRRLVHSDLPGQTRISGISTAGTRVEPMRCERHLRTCKLK